MIKKSLGHSAALLTMWLRRKKEVGQFMKLDTKRTFFVGFAFMSICAFWQVYDNIVPLILKNTFDVNDAVAGFIMAIDNVLALFMLPLFGALSDKTHTKIGKRMPFIVVGTIGACIFTMLLPIADNIESLWLFILGLGMVLLFMATYRSPAVALMPDVTPKPLRSRGNGIINLMGAIGGLIMLLVMAFVVPDVEKPSYLLVYIILVVFMLACVAILFFKINEPRLNDQMREESAALGDTEAADVETGGHRAMDPAVKKSFFLILASVFLWFMGYNAIITSFSKYASVYWGLTGGSFAYTLSIATAAAIITYIPAGMIAGKIGRRKTILIGISVLAVAFGSCIFFQSFTAMIFFFFVLAGIGWAMINVNSYPMVVEMSSGADVGKYTGYYYTVSMSAQIITPILSGALLEYGYLFIDRANPDAGYIALFPYGTLFVALSFITMLFVKHGDASPTPPKPSIESYISDN